MHGIVAYAPNRDLSVGLDDMKENETQQTATKPNWAHLMACCAFIAPIGVAAVALYHDAMRVSSGVPWRYLTTSFIVHPIVIAVSALAFTFIAMRWREFYKLPRARRWLATIGCWIVLVEAFAVCMVMT